MIQVVSDSLHDLFLLLHDIIVNHIFSSNVYAVRYLVPGLAIGVAISVLFIAFKIIKKIVWGS